MSRNDLIPFEHFTQFPARHDIGDAAIFLNAAHDYFGNEFAASTDQKFTVLFDTLAFADVHNHKIPFGISSHYLAFERVRQINRGSAAGKILGKFVF